MEQTTLDFLGGGENPFRAALLIAMTESMEQENRLIDYFAGRGCRCTATMVNGTHGEALRRVIGNVIGACLNGGLIERRQAHIHPLAHAVQEAVLGTRLDSSVGQNCRLKVGIARRGDAIAVVMYGDLGFHECSSHKTVGGGFQLLGA